MTPQDLQTQCELGQQLLMDTRYIEAREALTAAEAVAFQLQDFDTLARLYMPLQEAHRQIRQRCGEGYFNLRALAADSTEALDFEAILHDSKAGQFLVAGWANIEPAKRFREIAKAKLLYAETFLAAVYPLVGGAKVVAIVPTQDVALPDASPRSIDALIKLLPPHTVTLAIDQLPPPQPKGNTQTFGYTMNLWEQLSAPYLAAANIERDPIRKMEMYRKTIAVDSACELAHQYLSDCAAKLSKQNSK